MALLAMSLVSCQSSTSSDDDDVSTKSSNEELSSNEDKESSSSEYEGMSSAEEGNIQVLFKKFPITQIAQSDAEELAWEVSGLPGGFDYKLTLEYWEGGSEILARGGDDEEFIWNTSGIENGTRVRLVIEASLDDIGVGWDSTTYFDIHNGITEYTYEDDVEEILTTHCAECHMDGAEKGGFSFDGYDRIKEKSSYPLRIMNRVSLIKDMPKDKGQDLPTDMERYIVRDWILGGIPETKDDLKSSSSEDIAFESSSSEEQSSSDDQSSAEESSSSEEMSSDEDSSSSETMSSNEDSSSSEQDSSSSEDDSSNSESSSSESSSSISSDILVGFEGVPSSPMIQSNSVTVEWNISEWSGDFSYILSYEKWDGSVVEIATGDNDKEYDWDASDIDNGERIKLIIRVENELGGTWEESTSYIDVHDGTTELTYDDDIAPLIATYCAKCHVTGKAQSKLSLVSYSDIVSGDDIPNRMNEAVFITEEMPDEDELQPSDAERLKIRNWVLGGFPEN